MAAPYDCDRVVGRAAEGWFRAVTVRADAASVFPWLCQLRVAPYSYDLLDNYGRRSPRRLTPGVDELEVGQRFMTIFELASFSPREHVTLRLTDRRFMRIFGELAVSYTVRDHAPGLSRLVVKLAVTVTSRILCWGDLVMMHRQLLNLRSLAER